MPATILKAPLFAVGHFTADSEGACEKVVSPTVTHTKRTSPSSAFALLVISACMMWCTWLRMGGSVDDTAH